MGKSTINWPFSIATLNYQIVIRFLWSLQDLQIITFTHPHRHVFFRNASLILRSHTVGYSRKHAQLYRIYISWCFINFHYIGIVPWHSPISHYIYIYKLYKHIWFIYIPKSTSFFLVAIFHVFFSFGFPLPELDSKSDRRWRRDGCTEAGDPLRQWLSRLAYGACRFLRQDRRSESWGIDDGEMFFFFFIFSDIARGEQK